MKTDKGSVVVGSGLGLRLSCLVVALVTTLSSSGCTMFQTIGDYIKYNDSCDEFILNWRNECWSWQAWRARQHVFAGQPQFYAFGEGFRAGYKDVASGGDGCPPTIPPREYWGYRFQSPEGQSKVTAWFAGFPYGAQAAREDGAGGFREIAVAGGTNAQYSSGFQSGQCPNCGEVHLLYPDGSQPPGSTDGQPIPEHVPGEMLQVPAHPVLPPMPEIGSGLPSTRGASRPANPTAPNRTAPGANRRSSQPHEDSQTSVRPSASAVSQATPAPVVSWPEAR